jgi:hypothetical protein
MADQDIFQLPFRLVDFNEDLVPLLNRNLDEIARWLSNSQLYTKLNVKPFIENVNLMDIRNLVENSRADFGLAAWVVSGNVSTGGALNHRNGQSGDFYFVLAPGLGGTCQMEQTIDENNIDHREYYYLSAYYSTDNLTKGAGAYFRIRVTLTYHDATTQDFDLDIAI